MQQTTVANCMRNVTLQLHLAVTVTLFSHLPILLHVPTGQVISVMMCTRLVDLINANAIVVSVTLMVLTALVSTRYQRMINCGKTGWIPTNSSAHHDVEKFLIVTVNQNALVMVFLMGSEEMYSVFAFLVGKDSVVISLIVLVSILTIKTALAMEYVGQLLGMVTQLVLANKVGQDSVATEEYQSEGHVIHTSLLQMALNTIILVLVSSGTV